MYAIQIGGVTYKSICVFLYMYAIQIGGITYKSIFVQVHYIA